MSSQNNPTFKIKTFGCKVNQYDSQLIRERLLGQGFSEIDDGSADIYVINSCTVTHNADADTRNSARRFNRMNPGAKIVIVGCYAERDEDRQILMGIPGVRAVLGQKDKLNLNRFIEPRGFTVVAPFSSGFHHGAKSRTVPPSGGTGAWINQAAQAQENAPPKISFFYGHDRAFVKIQDGCGLGCSYCKVRLVRGNPVSRPRDDIIDEIKNLVNRGFKEIVLTGISVGAWGDGFRPKKELTDLLRDIESIPLEFRVRLSSIEPIYVTSGLIEFMGKSQKLCKHLHIPLQSGDDSILKRMRRPYTKEDFFQVIKKIRKTMPRAAITTDVMVGFPGEGEREFNNTYKFINRIRPSRIHIFTYSPRPGTDAFLYPEQVSSKVAKCRHKRIQGLADIFSRRFAEVFSGKSVRIVVENKRDLKTGLLTGYTDEYVKTLINGPDSLEGRIITIQHAGNIPVTYTAE